MTESSLQTQSSERMKRSRWSIIKPLAAVALVGSLASCAPGEHTTSHGRNAPESAPYSLDTDAEYYQDLQTAETYVPGGDAKERLQKLESQAVAEWLPANGDQAAGDIRTTLVKSSADHTIPVFVSYAIPDRDLGGLSAGGLDAASYRDYIHSVSDAIGQQNAIVVLEPDAVPQLHSLADPEHAQERAERIELLAGALDTLHTNTHTAVYLDAGNSAWQSAGEIAGYLHEIEAKTTTGIPGVALNVSNFQSDSASREYASELESAYGKPLYTLIDASRNGDPRAAQQTGDNPWCNPYNQYLGQADAVFNARARIEEVYIKTPGESDGQCNDSSMPAGAFDGKLLIEQLQR